VALSFDVNEFDDDEDDDGDELSGNISSDDEHVQPAVGMVFCNMTVLHVLYKLEM